MESPYALVYTAEGLPEDVAAELDQVRAVLGAEGGPALVGLDSVTGSDIWAAWLAAGGDKAIVRTGVAPRDLGRWLVEVTPELGTSSFIADIPSGLVYTRGGGRRSARRREKLGGYSAVVAGSAGTGDRWGRAPDGLDLMRALKAKWDAAGLVQPGCVPGVSLWMGERWPGAPSLKSTTATP